MERFKIQGIALLTLLLVSGIIGTAGAYEWNEPDLEGVYGTGENQALLVMDFSPEDGDSFAFGVNFDGQITGKDLLSIVSNGSNGDFSYEMMPQNPTSPFPMDVLQSVQYKSYSSQVDDLGGFGGDMLVYYSSSDLGENWQTNWNGPSTQMIGDNSTDGWMSIPANDFTNWETPPDTPTGGSSAVPIPGAVWLMGSGLIDIISLKRKS